MSVATGEPPIGEQERLELCALEPIRTPGAVQPHGALLAVDADFRITHASENTGVLFGLRAAELLGRPLDDVTGTSVLAALSDVLDPDTAAANPTTVSVRGAVFDAIVHRADARLVVELEPASSDLDSFSAPSVYSAMHRLTQTTTREEVWECAAIELRRLTGFDRVTIYHFHSDGHGEIVAEERVEELEPYLGLHFPASDIPAQARELYLTKLSRAIADSSREGSALLFSDEAPADALLDLSSAELRSVSPHHLHFMHNMGQASTLSLSIVHAGVLIGMVTCAHRTPRRIPFALRQALEILANQMALQLSSMLEIGRLQHQEERRAIRQRLVAQLGDGADIAETLLRGEPSLLDLIPADGAAVCLGGLVSTVGTAPSPDAVAEVAARLRSSTGGRTLVSETLAASHPELAELAPEVAGLIVMPFGSQDDFVAWFRPEIERSVNWLGDLSPGNRESTLSPRTSFSSWTRSVSGSSVSWRGAELDAAELCRDLDGALLRRAESKLAALALHDPLTGLPNRRLLLERIEQALTRFGQGEELALLYIDLDGFKTLNDSLGHDAGDRLLVHAAAQLISATRIGDTVARLGGDEFVVLLGDTTSVEADAVAARIGDALRTTVASAGGSLPVSASIGIATAAPSFNAIELLQAADAAMYRAKNLGRDQVAR